MRLITLLLFFSWIQVGLYGQSTQIKINLTDYPDKDILLAYHLGLKQYVLDTLHGNSSGTYEYRSDSMHPGIYLIQFPDNNTYFEFIVAEPRIEISATQKNANANAVATFSNENKIFFNYLKQINELKNDQKIYENGLNRVKGNPDSTAYFQKKENELNDRFTELKNSIVNQNPGSVLAKLLLAGNRPDVSGITDKTAQFYIYRSRFWEDYDFANTALLYSPQFETRLNEYFDNLTVMNPDSQILAADLLLRKTESNAEVFRTATIYVLNKFANSRVVCMDKAYVYMLEHYYLNGKAWWISAEEMDKMKNRYDVLKNCRCGDVAKNFRGSTASGNKVNLHFIPSTYIVLLFYDYQPSYRTDSIQNMISARYDSIRSLGGEVVAVNVNSDLQEWKASLQKRQLPAWINLNADENDLDFFRQNFDWIGYPIIYLLDSQKRIQYKRIDADMIPGLLRRLTNN